MKKITLLVCLGLCLSISACGPGQFFGPTLTLTPTNTLTPTITLTPTLTLTPTQTLTSTPTPVPAGPCDNPLTPLGAGNQWTYQATSADKSARFSLASLGIQEQANVVAQVAFSNLATGQSVTDLVICQSGAVVNYPLFILNMLFFNYLDEYIDVYHESGDYSPAYASLLQENWGMQWQSGYLTENGAYLRNPSGEFDLRIPINTHMDLAFSLNRLWEPVSVPAGDFPRALRMDLLFTIPVTVTMPGSGSGSGAVLKVNSTQWVLPYTGLLHAEITSATLQGQTIPIQSQLELVEFTPGQ